MQSNDFIRIRNTDYLNQKGKILVYSFCFYSKTRAIMAKRTIEDSKIEDSKIDFKYDDEEDQLRKKIKLENEKIVSKIKEIDQGIDISEHEVQKFLLIFHTLMQTVNSEQEQEETDGVVTDAILQIVIKITELLKNNIDSLNLPTVLKNVLKKIKFVYSANKRAGGSGECQGDQ